MIRFEDLYAIKKRYPTKYAWPTHDHFYAARKLTIIGERLMREDTQNKLYDPYMTEWIIACLDAFCAGAYDFIMYIDPTNSNNYAYHRADHKITLPSRQDVPLHFPYVPFNVKRALAYGEEHYKTSVVPGKHSLSKYRRLTKYMPNYDIKSREASSWEYFAKCWKKEFERTGNAKRAFGAYKAPFDSDRVELDAYRLNKVYASYIICLIMVAKELKERYMAGEFLDTEWKMTLSPVIK